MAAHPLDTETLDALEESLDATFAQSKSLLAELRQRHAELAEKEGEVMEAREMCREDRKQLEEERCVECDPPPARFPPRASFFRLPILLSGAHTLLCRSSSPFGTRVIAMLERGRSTASFLSFVAPLYLTRQLNLACLEIAHANFLIAHSSVHVAVILPPHTRALPLARTLCLHEQGAL